MSARLPVLPEVTASREVAGSVRTTRPTAHLSQITADRAHSLNRSKSMKPRIWLPGAARPADTPTVQDDQGRRWHPAGGQWHTADNRHHQTWGQLTARTDLVEVH